MNYYINIIDTEDNSHITVDEFAEKDSVILQYKGNDEKDEVKIVGSSLSITLEVLESNNVDAAFLHLFTGDETRYKVELRKEADNTLLWNGFLLPDSYNEPYIDGTFYVSFSATDGLGRLKGKFLPAAFYSEEQSVVAIIYECLKLTGLSMPMFVSPGVDNYAQKNWHEIYINTANFIEGSKKLDAYKILENFCNDTVSCIYQEFNRWHIVGLNKRNLVVYDVKHYDVSGVYVEDLEVSRNVKDVNQYIGPPPDVTMVPPFGYVRVSQERGEIQFKETQSKEVNDGWVVTTGVDGLIYATDWTMSAGFQVKAKAPDYNVYFENNESGVFDVTKLAALKNKLYLLKSMKFTISFELNIVDTDYNQEQNIVDTWINPIDYNITFNGNTLFSNKFGEIEDNEQIRFENSKSEKLSFDFVAQEDGLLDVIFYQPYKQNLELVALELSNLKIEHIGASEEEVFEEFIDGEYSITKEVELEFADDATGFSKAFQLATLDQNSASHTQLEIPALYSFTQNGLFYSAVSLQGANLIKDNIDDVSVTGQSIEVYDVVYNYQDNEEMVVQHSIENFAGSFFVKVYQKIDGPTDRTAWQQWTDSTYGIEKLRFGEVVKNIHRRMFAIPHAKVDATIDLPISFGDILKFNYQAAGNYFVTNLKWNIDSGQTTITMPKAVYQNDDSIGAGDNIPPFVDAGNVIYITQNQTSVTLTSESGDPDGFIASFFWEQITAVAGVSFATPLSANTVVNNLTADFYTFQITVIDNEGAAATDTVNVVRLNDYLIELIELSNTTVPTGAGEIVTKQYRLESSPDLPNDFNLNIDAEFYIDLSVQDLTDDISIAKITVEKNGVLIVDEERSMQDYTENTYDEQTAIPFNYRESDTVIITVRADAYFTPPDGLDASAEIRFTINNITFATGNGTITTVLPLERIALAQTT